MQHYL